MTPRVTPVGFMLTAQERSRTVCVLKLTALAEEASKDHKRCFTNCVSVLATTVLPVGDANAANRVAQQPGFRGLIFRVFFPFPLIPSGDFLLRDRRPEVT